MAYNIIRHRRGTESDWKRLNLVPEEGEIIIIEFKDGTRECKIGDGVRSFIQLPYLGEKARNKLLEEIDGLKQKLDIEVSNIDTKLKNSEQTLVDKINEVKASFKNVKADIKERVKLFNELFDQLEEQTLALAK